MAGVMKPLQPSNEEPLIPHNGLEVPESMVYFVYMTVFIDTLAACISTPVMPYYAESFHVSVAWIGYLYGAWSFSSTVFAPMLSGMADRWGRKRVLVICLVGAGVANIIQGVALFVPKIGFWVFLFGRAFSGVWASVGATCSVYISDVAPESVRASYLEKQAMVPIFAILLGPGLGGALAAAFNNNAPVLVDGLITLFSACTVACYLVETPAFLKMKAKVKQAKVEGGDGAAAEKPKNVGKTVHVVGLAAFFRSISSSANLSTYALFYKQRYDMSPLYVGFVFILMSLAMLLSNMIFVPVMKRMFRPSQAMFVGGVLSGACTVVLGFSESLPFSLTFMFLGTVFGAVTNSQAAVVTASLTDISNRGKIFGLLQTYGNTGRIVGPVAATHIAAYGIGVPICISGIVLMLASSVYLLIDRMSAVAPAEAPGKAKPRLTRGNTKYGDEWENEAGGPEDVEAIGKYVAGLLTKRHYRWVSRREEVERLLDVALPELTTDHREGYEESFSKIMNCRSCVRDVGQV